MNNNTTEYSKKKHRPLIAIAVALIAILLIGVTAAFYSDLLLDNTNNVGTGSLKLQGTFQCYINDSETPTALTSLPNLIPGDAVVISGTIQNIGTQSAWLRELITIDTVTAELWDSIEVYSGAQTVADLRAGTVNGQLAMPLSVDGVAVSSEKVIDGTSEVASTLGGGFTFLNSTTYNFAITVYFSHEADNAAQNATFSIAVALQALQFANNNSAVPTALAWQSVTAA